VTISRRTKQVTKSVRFSAEENALIEQISHREHLAEGTLLRKLVLEGITRYRLEAAIHAYTTGEVNLSEAAREANVSVQHLMAELDRRHIGLGSGEHVVTSLENLADLFGGSQELRDTIADLKARRGA
jgi:predicted HTH domain antitoxin